MTSILIPSLLGDTDSMILQLSLQRRGHHVDRWIGDNFPSVQTSTYAISNASDSMGYIQGTGGKLSTQGFDVVWLRRPRWPIVPNCVHSDDIKIVEQECRHYIRSLFQASWQDAIWVNSLEARRKANSKLLHLKLAKQTGMGIPSTIVSNDPEAIKQFLAENEGEVIVKALLGGDWTEGGERLVTYTAALAKESLPDDDVLQACPCIFQTKVTKKSEVRIVFFGAEAVAVELDSQSRSITSLDWRIGNPAKILIRPIEIPHKVYAQCRTLMADLGIVHGSFDFAIEPNGNWTFFEVNESGQFLWFESYVPALPILEIATQFFSAPSTDFKWRREGIRSEIVEICQAEEYRELVQKDEENMQNLEMTAML